MLTELTDLAGRLVAVESVNPDLVPGGGGEGAVARVAAEWLEGAGLDVSREEVAPGRWNVVAVARGSGGGRTLLLNGHLDTVGTAGMERPLEPRAVPTTFQRPAPTSSRATSNPASSSQEPTNAAISVSPAPPGTRSGFTESMATRRRVSSITSSRTGGP